MEICKYVLLPAVVTTRLQMPPEKKSETTHEPREVVQQYYVLFPAVPNNWKRLQKHKKNTRGSRISTMLAIHCCASPLRAHTATYCTQTHELEMATGAKKKTQSESFNDRPGGGGQTRALHWMPSGIYARGCVASPPPLPSMNFLTVHLSELWYAEHPKEASPCWRGKTFIILREGDVIRLSILRGRVWDLKLSPSAVPYR